MLVGNKNIPFDVLKENCNSVEALSLFAESLVPRILRHNNSVVNNQKYLVALTVRQIKSLPFYVRQDLCEDLLRGVHITGVSSVIYDFDDLLNMLDVNKLAEVLVSKQRR